MKKNASASRRDFLRQTAQTGAAIAASQLLPPVVLAQDKVGINTIEGKEKLIVRSLRPEDLETPVGLLNTYLTPKELFTCGITLMRRRSMRALGSSRLTAKSKSLSRSPWMN